MSILPPDIAQKINELFTSTGTAQEAAALIARLWITDLNVGKDQLARSILTISGGDLTKLKSLLTLNDDPRDIIMTAESLSGNPGHYFMPTFDQINNGQ